MAPPTANESVAQAGIEQITAYLQPGLPPAFLLIAVVPSSREREVAHAIFERLPPDSPVQEFRFTPDSLEPVEIIGDPKASAPGLVFLFGLSELGDDPRDKALYGMNLARESLRASRHSFLCFCHPEHVRTIASRAPDLYATISGLVKIDLTAADPLLPSSLIVLPVVEAQVLRRRAELYRCHVQAPYVVPESRGQALLDLGDVLLRLGKVEEGQEARDEGLRILADREAYGKVLEAYLQDLLIETKVVRLSDLAVQAGHQILTVPLDDIYVPLRMVKEEERDIPRQSLEDQPVTALAKAAPAFWQLVTRHGIKESRPLSMQELLEIPRAVILGDPGSGKSTLLRYIARLLARPALGMEQPEGAPLFPESVRGLIPIVVPVIRLAAHLTQEGCPDLERFIRNDLSKLPGVGATLIRCLENREAFLLIDGLDEVPASLRGPVRDAVEDYLLSHREIRCFATSRIVGYEAARLGIGFVQVRLQELEDEGIQRFARRWYETIRGIGAIHEEPKIRAERLWDAISASPGIRRIAGNPLLLTIIGLVHYRGSRLPDKRVEVYEAATRTLLDNWLARRPFVSLRNDEILRILPRIAFEMHELPIGLVPYRWLRERFTKSLAEVRMTDEADVSREVDGLLQTLSQHSGLLLERGWSTDGQSLFGFLHFTFQEYLAALSLFEQWITAAMPVPRGRANRKKHPDNPIYRYLFSTRWQEVILLAAGMASNTSQAAATRFLEHVLAYRDRYEQALNRRILVAGRLLGDGPSVERKLAHVVCELIVTFWFRNGGPIRRIVRDIISQLGHSDYGRFVLEALLDRLGGSDPRVRQAAAEALGALKDPRAVEPLIARLSDDHAEVRRNAAAALGDLRDPYSLEPLLVSLTDKDHDVRLAAASALQKLRDPRALGPLLSMLNAAEAYLRQAAAWALGDLRDPRALELLLVAMKDKDWSVHRSAVVALGKIRDRNSVDKLLRFLTDSDPSMRRGAAWVLGDLRDSRTVEPLIARLADEDASVRWAAAGALGDLRDLRAVEPLIGRLADENARVRWAAASALGRLGDPRASEPLAAATRDESPFARGAASLALSEIGDPRAINFLTVCLEDDEPNLRRLAAMKLGPLRNPRSFEPLLRKLRDKEPFVREAAASALGQLRNPRAVKPLLALLADCTENVRFAAAVALGNIGTRRVVKALDGILLSKDQSGARPKDVGSARIDKQAARQALFFALTNLERGN